MNFGVYKGKKGIVRILWIIYIITIDIYKYIFNTRNCTILNR